MDNNKQAPANYFIRIQGKVLGPYSIAQLKTLIQRGQFGRGNEVSVDGKMWKSAMAIAHLFQEPSGNRTQSSSSATQEPHDSATAHPGRSMAPIWYYAVGNEQCGPVSVLDLRKLIASNQLVRDDLVWKEGMPDWTAIRDVPELNVVAKSGVASAPLPASGQPKIGSMTHKFCFACGSPNDPRAEVCPSCGVRQPNTSSAVPKNRITAAILALCLGGIGVHHFYLGNTVVGAVYLVFCWTLVPGIFALVEGIFMLCMSDATFEERYKLA